MSDYPLFTKEEALSFIEKFPQLINKIEEPMIGWYGDGAMELSEAKEQVENGFLPEGISVVGKRPDEDYWDSVFIHKDDDGDYLITTGDMSSVSDKYVNTINDALVVAQKSLIEYINE